MFLKPLVDQEIVMGIRPESIHDEEMFISSARTIIIETTVDVNDGC